MLGRKKVLPVPYFTQPTAITCQSTVLKMFATYLESVVLKQSRGAAERPIQDIWKEINTGTARPSQVRNAHSNMKWWLEQNFPQVKFEYTHTTQEDAALESIVRYIDSGYPVLMAVSHARVQGHIVLVVGYEGYQPGTSSTDFALIIHDPYGKFDPSLMSKLYGVTGKKLGLQGGASLVGGGEIGPGAANHLPLQSASRQRIGDSARGSYYLISARGVAATAAVR